MYQKRPSEVMAIDDGYTAFCLDEACAELFLHLQKGEEPRFRHNYTKASDFYKKFDICR